MNKCIAVVDSAGKTYEPTYPKRAKGLVKHGRARFVNENTLCLTCPPDMKTEEARSMNNIFGEMTVADILSHINNISNQHILRIYEKICDDLLRSSGLPAAEGTNPNE